MSSFPFNVLLIVICIGVLWTCAATSQSEITTDDLWHNFKVAHSKRYIGMEEESRRKTFHQNVKFIAKHNVEADLGFHTFWLSINQFADQTHDEFIAHTSSSSVDSGFKSNSTYTGYTWDIPDHVDWRSKGIVTPIKDEDSCRSSWAFAAVASIEGQHALFTDTLVSLSEQQLIDCSTDFGNRGCHHGSVNRALKYIQLTGGIDASDTYPYHGVDMICQFDRQHVVSRVSGFVSVLDDEDVLRDAVANVGPTSVSLNVRSVYMQFYDRGILSEITCPAEDTNHAMTVIGYGSHDGQDFWLLKNSWGTAWGEDGYLRLSRDQDNLCGIASNAVYPLLQTF